MVNQREPADNEARNAVELANHWFQAHDAVDAVRLGSLLHPDVVVRSLFSARPVQGRRAAVAHFQRTMADYPDLRLRIVAGPVAAQGPSGQRVVADIFFEGHHRSSSTERTRVLSVPGVVVLEMTSTAVTGVRTYFDKTEWLRQIGLLEEAAPI
ncbi:nuclear transport factor 2 family protein [Mycobacterium sp. 21AC1]|uniref:nuclear transport factor 2 family protein n=1 Tax=[Mycobacterium] appelbergii TaxID=2939269 RepID=UPI002939056B|nr:nuclear transport factor 2 family protein [Mycobacterium sp. 21AC1]MDV3128636.1 nuclear transport factor 2 family protein [Mycobacterium sp. 21AC1]